MTLILLCLVMLLVQTCIPFKFNDHSPGPLKPSLAVPTSYYASKDRIFASSINMADKTENQATVDETPISPSLPDAANKNSLEKHLMQRPDRKELIDSRLSSQRCILLAPLVAVCQQR